MNPVDWGLAALFIGMGWVAAPFVFILLLFGGWVILYYLFTVVDWFIYKKRQFVRWWNAKNQSK